MTILTGDMCFSLEEFSISELLAYFKSFSDSLGNSFLNLFWRTVVHVLSRNDRQFTPPNPRDVIEP